MKRKLLCVLVFLQLGLTGTFAQAISSQLKSADCDYRIQICGHDLKVEKQMISMRAVVETTWENNRKTGAAGYGAYHLEMAYTGHRIDLKMLKYVEFKDRDNKVLFTISLRDSSRYIDEQGARSKQFMHYFALNLEGIPLFMLDDVVEINFED